MICSKCGRLLNEDFKFCPECATPINASIDTQNNMKTEDLIESQKQDEGIQIELPKNLEVDNSEKTKFRLKKAFLITMIASLSISALIGIAVILVGNLGETESKILGTTLALGGFSLLGLCCSTLFEKKKYKILSITGMSICFLGFLQSALMIWNTDSFLNSEWNIKLLVTLIIISLSMAQASILLLINYKNKKARNVLWITLGLICVVSIMVLLLIYEIVEGTTEQYIRILSVFAILDALGTITTPILNKIGGKQ